VAYGAATEYGRMLPFSRKHETEADRIGLILVAIAGIIQNKQNFFGPRMSSNSGGQAPPEFMSTHPSDATKLS
jgi:predicted Zn-dependent protease